MMLILLLVVALIDGVFGQNYNICDASEDQKNTFISCIRREYQSFDYALTCSQYLDVRETTDFVDLSCGRLNPSSEGKAKYSECLMKNIDLRNAINEYDLDKLLNKCTNLAMSR